MSLQIGDALGDGIRRSLTYSGGVLMVLTFVYQLLFLGSVNAVFIDILPPEAQQSGQLGFALPVPAAVASVIAVVGLAFGVVLYIAATRALTREQSELNSLPGELFTRRMGRAFISSIGANIIVTIAVTIGFILLFVPGIFLAISFIFVIFAIGVEDERAMDSLSRSWELASGNRWGLFALGLIVGVITAVGSSIGSVASFVSPAAGQVLSLALTSVFAIISYGILADAYLQVRGEKPGSGGGTTEPTSDPEAL
ncbi:hypothetical protein [Natronomonas gomsonensis]|uniref:hypothetical protein n=1 Tax=Natronomonas gomsonensis TaxID=1046043 RepID=UPI0015C1135D|nr:hypothetical protein [Natronomonas gomsonensis]